MTERRFVLCCVLFALVGLPACGADKASLQSGDGCEARDDCPQSDAAPDDGGSASHDAAHHPPGSDSGHETPPADDDGGTTTPPGADAGALPPAVDAGPAAPPADRPGDHVVFIDYPASRSDSDPGWGAALTDIAQHLPPEYGYMYWDDDPITAGHETTHGINSDLRNYHNDTGQRANGFYVLHGHGVILVEPSIRKSDAAPYIPASLHGSRYDLYIDGQTEWDDTPTYIFDEWVAYTNGGEVGVDMVTSGVWGGREWQDGVAGQLEFCVYSMALGMAVEAGDATYFTTYAQFREFLAWNARRAMDVYRRGAAMPEFSYDVQDTYLHDLQTSPDAAQMRAWIVRVYGADFAREVFGISG